ncbi:MAG: SirB2 family protein [Shewanella sp.]|uniref:SirB2 family protein n=1 Tax=Shewanella sp. TaxID=50422 RepID=UPI00264A3491|nr:SirB2 family protein [Shewanella sp.]MDN5502061.1 SirB2 family protein [Shewanella sp.]MDN5529992.1 SirB2 family protein [Shewanella sp.]
MVTYYTLIKNLHIMLALVSVAQFTYRWLRSFCASAGMQSKYLKVLPHINDALLLLTGVVLIAILKMNVVDQSWLIAKLIALVVYIGLGVLAIKRQHRRQKVLAGIAALLVFSYIVGVSMSHAAWFRSFLI